MDGLNSGVITGKCSGCVALRVMALTVERSELEGNCPFCGVYRAHKRLVCGDRVARLEGELAALAAALGDFVEAVPPNPDFTAEDGVKVYGLQMDELDINRARAALSDTQTGTAGEGWPEVREQVREAIRFVLRREQERFDSPLGTGCPCVGCHRLRAALDALEEAPDD